MQKTIKKTLLLFSLYLVIFSLSACGKVADEERDYNEQYEQLVAKFRKIEAKMPENVEQKTVDISDWQIYNNVSMYCKLRYPRNWGSMGLPVPIYEREGGADGKTWLGNRTCFHDDEDADVCKFPVEVTYHGFGTLPRSKKQLQKRKGDYYSNYCDAGEIPLLEFEHDLKPLFACQNIDNMGYVWHHYFVEGKRLDYILSLYYKDDELTPAAVSEGAKGKEFYSYENHKRFDLSTQRAVIKAFEVAE